MMCEVCNVQNMQKVILFTDAEIADYVNVIFHGKISEDELNEALYNKTANALKDALELGFGSKKADLSKTSPEWDLLADLIQSIYPFSAAKQYQFLRECAGSEDKEELTRLFKVYYINYLSAEIDSAEWQARSAKNWLNITK